MVVTFEAVTIVMWTLTGVCILLTIGRYAIRFKISKRFFGDDIAHLCALGWLIIFSSITEYMLQTLELPGMDPPQSAISEFCRLQTAQGATFYFLHWTVKFSFLLFYRELFWVSQSFRRAWWCVAAFVLLGLGVALAGIMTQQGPVDRMDDPTVCTRHNNYQRAAGIYTWVVNVSTDLAVMLLPLGMLRNLKIRKTQKLGLLLVFSVCLLTIALELFRFVRNITGDRTTNNVLYAVVNANLTVMISCTPTYRSLWTLWQRSRSRASSGDYSFKDDLRPRQSVHKLDVAESDISSLASTYGDGPVFSLQEIHRSDSSWTLQIVEPVMPKPSSDRV